MGRGDVSSASSVGAQSALPLNRLWQPSPEALGHHLAHAVLELPFAHLSSFKAIDNAQVENAIRHITRTAGEAASRLGEAASALPGFHRIAVPHRGPQPRPLDKAASIALPRRPRGRKSDSTASPIDGEIVCIEYTRGKRRVYCQQSHNGATGAAGGGFSVQDDAVTNSHRLGNVVADYLLPQGYPDSVAPQYATYMGWRGVQYFFGGAMSVFTTRSLLRSLGVANRHSGEAAAAINWVVKDGAGRLGRFLFARWGRSLDCELKQFRLAGDILMETGAALELSTALAPNLFLPLACTANLAKNLAAVAASSTRAPIYRTFARANNMADVTAKGESVANVADVVGTAFGILLAKANVPVVPTFALLSVGYLIASRKEVDSVELPYFNRARLSYAARKFLDARGMSTIEEANHGEPLLPWSDPAGGRIVLGATVEEACAGPADLKAALDSFQGKQYALTYRPETKKVYVLLRSTAGAEDTLHAAFDAHAVLHMVNAGQRALAAKSLPLAPSNGGTNGNGSGRAVGKLHKQVDALATGEAMNGEPTHEAAVSYIAANGKELFKQFESQARDLGWRMNLTMLNTSETRLAVA